MAVSTTIIGEETRQLSQRALETLEVGFIQVGQAIAQPGSRPGIALGQRRRAGGREVNLDSAPRLGVRAAGQQADLNESLNQLRCRGQARRQVLRKRRKARPGVAPHEDQEPELRHGHAVDATGSHLLADRPHRGRKRFQDRDGDLIGGGLGHGPMVH